MDNSGFHSLGSFTITTAGTQTGDWVEDLEGALALAAQMRLAYGSGGTSISVYLQTSLDQGTTPTDIACFTFTTASAVKARNLSALTPKTSDVVPSDGGLTADTSVDGVLGDRFRIKLVSVGTYAGSTVVTASAVLR